MKKLRLLKKREDKFESLGVKFINPLSICMCDHDQCEAECGCGSNPSEFAHSAWNESGSVDSKLYQIIPPQQ